MSSSPAGSPAVQITRLVKRYGGVDVVDQLDLVAEVGALTAVLGPNGAGKTTTIECCEGLRKPDSGTVRVLGLDPVADARRLRPRVGVMLQDGGLPTAPRSGELLAHVARMYSAPRAVAELSERLALDSFARTPVRRLSGGQRQRLALAIALVGRPEVVFLDEPSAGLDPQSRHAVWDLIRELRRDGVTIILTTHLMDEAAALADHVSILDHGHVIAGGTVESLTQTGPSRHLNITSAASQNTPPEFRAHLAERISRRSASTRGDGMEAPDATKFSVEWVSPGQLRIDGPVTPAVLADVTSWYAEHDVQIRSLDLGERTLEDVFLDLTGRNLR